MTWTLVHPHDYFIAGIVVGVLLNCWVFVLILLYRESRSHERDDGLDTVTGQDFLPHTRT
jgi:hypothetical protein